MSRPASITPDLSKPPTPDGSVRDDRSAGGHSSRSKSKKKDKHAEPDEGRDAALSGLISFGNLESVVKHIMSRFKIHEERLGGLEENLSQVADVVGSKAQITDLEDQSFSQTQAHDKLAELVTKNANGIVELESALELLKAHCVALEKRIDTAAREKAVQDRILREMQDQMNEKADVTELNMFEAKFAGYTPKEDFQDVLEALSSYTRQEVTEKLAEYVKSLSVRFDDYLRPAQIELHLQEIKETFAQDLAQYAKREQIADELRNLENDFQDAAVSNERTVHVLDEKIRALTDRLTSSAVELHDELGRCAPKNDLLDVRKELQRFADAQDLLAFKQDATPKISKCLEKIASFEARLDGQDSAVSRVNEVVLDKASKWDVHITRQKIESAMTVDQAETRFQQIDTELTHLHRQLEHYVSQGEVVGGQTAGPDYGEDLEHMSTKMALKADKADLAELFATKATRVHGEELSRTQELVQRQLEYLAATCVGLAKLVLTDAKAGESRALRLQQRNQVLMQSESLWAWILNAEVPQDFKSVLPSKKLRPPPDPQNRAEDLARHDRLESKLGIVKPPPEEDDMPRAGGRGRASIWAGQGGVTIPGPTETPRDQRFTPRQSMAATARGSIAAPRGSKLGGDLDLTKTLPRI